MKIYPLKGKVMGLGAAGLTGLKKEREELRNGRTDLGRDGRGGLERCSKNNNSRLFKESPVFAVRRLSPLNTFIHSAIVL